jgi:hypothetical protein
VGGVWREPMTTWGQLTPAFRFPPTYVIATATAAQSRHPYLEAICGRSDGLRDDHEVYSVASTRSAARGAELEREGLTVSMFPAAERAGHPRRVLVPCLRTAPHTRTQASSPTRRVRHRPLMRDLRPSRRAPRPRNPVDPSGTDHPTNLQPLCARCNLAKSDRYRRAHDGGERPVFLIGTSRNRCGWQGAPHH